MAEQKKRGNPWPKGKSGNPKGRPKDGESIAGIFAAVLGQEDVPLSKDKKISRYRAIVLKLSQMAIEGNVAAAVYCVNRIEGMPIQSLKVGGDKENPIRFTTDLDVGKI